MFRFALTLIAGAIAAAPAFGQDAAARWPERPVRFIVPFTAGSSSDTVARIVAQKLGERLGQQLVVENRVGGGGTIGTEMVARANPMATCWGSPIPARMRWRTALPAISVRSGQGLHTGRDDRQIAVRPAGDLPGLPRTHSAGVDCPRQIEAGTR